MHRVAAEPTRTEGRSGARRAAKSTMSRRRLQLQLALVRVTYDRERARGSLDPLTMTRLRQRSRAILEDLLAAAQPYPDLAADLAGLIELLGREEELANSLVDAEGLARAAVCWVVASWSSTSCSAVRSSQMTSTGRPSRPSSRRTAWRSPTMQALRAQTQVDRCPRGPSRNGDTWPPAMFGHRLDRSLDLSRHRDPHEQGPESGEGTREGHSLYGGLREDRDTGRLFDQPAERERCVVAVTASGEDDGVNRSLRQPSRGGADLWPRFQPCAGGYCQSGVHSREDRVGSVLGALGFAPSLLMLLTL